VRRLLFAGVTIALILFGSPLHGQQAPSQTEPPAAEPVFAKDGRSAVYPVPLDKVFKAAAQAAASKWVVSYSDKDTGTISFHGGKSVMWNRTLDLSVLCTSVADTQTKVEIKTQKATNAGLLSFSHDKGVVKDFFDALTDRLRETGDLPPKQKGR
jgi:hypothetical protein